METKVTKNLKKVFGRRNMNLKAEDELARGFEGRSLRRNDAVDLGSAPASLNLGHNFALDTGEDFIQAHTRAPGSRKSNFR